VLAMRLQAKIAVLAASICVGCVHLQRVSIVATLAASLVLCVLKLTWYGARVDRTASGLVNGLIGVVIFSASLPATRAAVQQFDPVFLTVARAAIAGLLGLALLLAFREKRPARADLVPLAIVALGVVVGFPLLTALALRYVTSAHSIVFIGLLPLATAALRCCAAASGRIRNSGCSPGSAVRWWPDLR
jgi:EamA-like transporter family